MINLREVGAYASVADENGVDITFGIYLPGITSHDGYEVHVQVLHKADHFYENIQPRDFLLNYQEGSTNELWTAQVHLSPEDGSHFGLPGSYFYRYQLLQQVPDSDEKKIITRWFTDPFALATDIGLLSAVVTPESFPAFEWTDEEWKTPELADLVVYELHVEEFNSNFAGVMERIPFLKSLGVNCLELMPITSLKLNFNWGYEPLHYFAPYERWGGIQGLKQLVDACHSEGIAVILDVVYQHVDPSFPYNVIYKDTELESPMIGGDGPFGPEIDFSKDFAREYIQTANYHWLHEYHIDGFRYDEVTDLYDGPMGIQYAHIAYNTYIESLKIGRFTPTGKAGEYSRLIQCTEAQNRPQEILKDTFSTSTWQDSFRCMAEGMAETGTVDEHFVHQVLLDQNYTGYPSTKTVQDIEGQPVDMPVMPFQYLENHDNSQLISHVAILPDDIPYGDRSQFYKLQPFAIALYTCEGTPMLWQGQEFAQNYVLPTKGRARVGYQRNVNWEYFYDEYGTPLVHLYRTLGSLRRTYAALRSRESFYYVAESRIEDKVVAYRRHHGESGQVAIIFLNFSDAHQKISVPFPFSGTYREMIDHDKRPEAYDITVSEDNQSFEVEVPGHYGFVLIKE
ncbi:hypothetical protein KDA_04230 [Dictyobacter alpinus]|uniref:Glycosyl hydrolase family 13 catalytic domain-containing protein n=1 Tax=Dictyobacter alpinus TaxID=2014873 RepID=A0A402B0R7_9CHLR|nr:alpha-amylase family glycosyl hydrolase [Dictyobacter alpinus]GCE24939.1 hypothetical protein KDA_04230 [Dictyobacter alpinus]